MTTAVAEKTTEKKDREVFRQELGELFEQYAPMLLRAANSILGNLADAEDALQNVFVKLLDRPPSIDFDKNPPGFLYRCIINESLSFIEFRKRENLVDDDITEIEIAVYTEETTTEEREEIAKRLEVARAKLNPYLSVLLTLRYEANMSCEEIARFLRRTRMAIFVSLKRAETLVEKLMSAPGDKK